MKNRIKRVLMSFHKHKVNNQAKVKVRKIDKNTASVKIDDTIISKYKILWAKLNEKPSVEFLECMVSVSGVESYKYVPENIYYNIIEPILNNRAYALAYNDKNFFERYLFEYKDLFPLVVLRGGNGRIQGAEYESINIDSIKEKLNSISDNEQLILKPSIETGGGDNVLLVTKQQDKWEIKGIKLETNELIDYFWNRYNCNFILQYRIIQHDWFSVFNESSINTVRLYIYRSVRDNRIIPLSAYLRFGNPGSVVDSSSQGGKTCGISMEGILNNFAISRYGKKYHNLIGLKTNKGTYVPRFHEMIEIAKKIAPSFNYHRLLGFDFIVDDKNDLKLLEINNLYIGIINQQMNTGPLFKEYTEEVIDYCMNKDKTFALHFSMK